MKYAMILVLALGGCASIKADLNKSETYQTVKKWANENVDPVDCYVTSPKELCED